MEGEKTSSSARDLLEGLGKSKHRGLEGQEGGLGNRKDTFHHRDCKRVTSGPESQK